MHRHCLIRLHQIDKCTLGIPLNRGILHQRHLPVRVHKQTCIHELIREKGTISVLEERLQLQSSRGGINLVVQRFKNPGRDLFLLPPVKRIHRQPISRA
jgi:hypothetical protein